MPPLSSEVWLEGMGTLACLVMMPQLCHSLLLEGDIQSLPYPSITFRYSSHSVSS